MRRWVVAEAAASEEGTCARPAALWEFVPSMYASMLHDKSQLPCLWESHMPPRQPLPSGRGQMALAIYRERESAPEYQVHTS